MAGGEEFETDKLRRDLRAQRSRIDEISRRLFAVEDELDKSKTEEDCLEELISIGNGLAGCLYPSEPGLVQQWDAAREAFQRYGREEDTK